MLNPCRRICETYYKFVKKDPGVFYKDNPYAKKMFDVNQHSIDDLEAELNGKSKEQVKDILAKLFEDNSAKEHFDHHWKGGRQ